MNYRLIYEERELYYTESVIINGLLPFRFNKVYRIESLKTSNNHIVVYRDNVGLYMESYDDNLYRLYKNIYLEIKRTCLEESKNYFIACDKIKPTIEVVEKMTDDNIKVWEETDFSNLKFNTEISLKSPIFTNIEVIDNIAFNDINKMLSPSQAVILTNSELIQLFYNKENYIGKNKYMFIVLNYMSKDVDKIYNRYKEIVSTI